MLSRTAQYALRAMIELARHAPGTPVAGEAIARLAVIPRKYLSKILGDLSRAGLLESTRGKGGGYKLARPAEQIFLQEVLAPIEALESRRCPFSNLICRDDNPCAAHERWKAVRSVETRFFSETSIAEVASASAPTPTRRGAKGRRGKPSV